MANIKIKLNPDQEIVSTIREVTGEEERIEMEIRKRNGESVPFQQEKIFNAMKKAFDGQGREIGSRELDEILATVLDNLSVTVPLTVERVQDEVERTLMERGHYEVAKAYILYREKRSALRRVRHTIARTVGDDSLDEVLRRIQMDFTEEVYSLAALQMKFESRSEERRVGKECRSRWSPYH